MKLSKIALAHLPTRIEYLSRLSEVLGGPQIYCKRDDQTGLGFGGNKIRKLEFLLADAMDHQARTLVSVGAIQSNHCRQVAALAARAGLDCILVLSGEKPEIATGNLYLDQLFGAEIVWADRENRLQVLDTIIEQTRNDGRAPYKIPYGGSNAVGVMGYLEAMNELREDEKKQGFNFNWIVTASSSGGTQAGMILGSLVWLFTGKILGIAIEGTTAELGQTMRQLIKECMELNQLHLRVPESLINVNDAYTGKGYGIMGEPEIEAIRLFAQHEGLLLDPVYTSRAAAGMIDLIRNGFFRKEDKVLFWHTGGTPALFGEPYLSQLQ